MKGVPRLSEGAFGQIRMSLFVPLLEFWNLTNLEDQRHPRPRSDLIAIMGQRIGVLSDGVQEYAPTNGDAVGSYQLLRWINVDFYLDVCRAALPSPATTPPRSKPGPLAYW